MNRSILNKYSFFWVTLALFLVSLTGHWVTAWSTYVDEQAQHNQPVEVNKYVIQTTRDTLENWQSEFLQLIWQVAGLSFLYYIGSPQSKDDGERKEEKIDEILKKLGHAKVIKELDKKYPRK